MIFRSAGAPSKFNKYEEYFSGQNLASSDLNSIVKINLNTDDSFVLPPIVGNDLSEMFLKLVGSSIAEFIAPTPDSTIDGLSSFTLPSPNGAVRLIVDETNNQYHILSTYQGSLTEESSSSSNSSSSQSTSSSSSTFALFTSTSQSSDSTSSSDSTAILSSSSSTSESTLSSSSSTSISSSSSSASSSSTVNLSTSSETSSSSSTFVSFTSSSSSTSLSTSSSSSTEISVTSSSSSDSTSSSTSNSSSSSTLQSFTSSSSSSSTSVSSSSSTSNSSSTSSGSGPFSAQFNSGEFLTISDNTDLSMGDVDFSISTWVRYDDVTDFPTFAVSKGSEYSIRYINNTTAGFRFTVDSGVISNDVDINPSMVNDRWYMVTVTHNSVDNEISIKINDGDTNTVSHSGGAQDLSNDFIVGAADLVGRISMTRIWKNRVLTDDEINQLYNNGDGYLYADLPAGLLTNIVANWDLQELNGTRFDQEGSNDLSVGGIPPAIIRGSGPVASENESFSSSTSSFSSSSSST